jgi:hypothetical protein
MDRNRIVTVFSLLFVLAAVNMAVGGPHALPRLPHGTAMMVAGICGGLSLLLMLVLAIDGGRTTRREIDEEVRRELAIREQKEILRHRLHQIAKDPKAPPETLAEQIERKKLGL